MPNDLNRVAADPSSALPRSLVNPRIDVVGVEISDTDPEDAVATVVHWLEQGQTDYVCVTPVSGVMAAQRDPRVREALNGAGMTVPDGMPVAWCGRWAGAEGMRRVYGPDLMLDLCSEATKRGWPSYFYGGKPGVAEKVAERLGEKFDGFRVAGAECPPFRELTAAEVNGVAARIDASGARFVWVGLSTPKQDLLMARLVERVSGPVTLIGVGAAFDVHAGLVQRPPAWLGPLGLWWLYRLLQEPRRLWRRYLVDNPQFVASVLRRRPTRKA